MRIFSLYLYQIYIMPRNRRLRKIMSPPRFKGYKPYGCMEQNHAPIELFYEEYEAIKLADYKLLNHQEAAVLMDISRATFARIYENARRKIALALVETKEIKTVSGNSYTDKTWFTCKKCFARFTIPSNITKHACAICNSQEIENLQQNP